jgi:hypothetical protein
MNTYFLILLFSICIFIGMIYVIKRNEKLNNFEKSTLTSFTYNRNAKIIPSRKFLSTGPQNKMFTFNKSSLNIP